MSEAVQKPGMRPLDTARPQSTTQKIPRTQPGATAQKVSADPAAAKGSPTSYSAMLDEAYDGDTTEALAVAQSARRTGEGKEGDYRLDDTVARTERGRPRATPQQQSPEDSNLLEGMRRRQATGAVERYNSNATAPAPVVSAKASHDQLILASNDMGQAETATHINFKTFQALTQILSKRNWARLAGVEQHLAGRQMAGVNPGVR